MSRGAEIHAKGLSEVRRNFVWKFSTLWCVCTLSCETGILLVSDMSFPTTPSRCGEAFHLLEHVQSADWLTTSGNVVNVSWRLTGHLEQVRQRVTGGTVQFGTLTFPERLCMRSRDLRMHCNAYLEVWCV